MSAEHLKTALSSTLALTTVNVLFTEVVFFITPRTYDVMTNRLLSSICPPFLNHFISGLGLAWKVQCMVELLPSVVTVLFWSEDVSCGRTEIRRNRVSLIRLWFDWPCILLFTLASLVKSGILGVSCRISQGCFEIDLNKSTERLLHQIKVIVFFVSSKTKKKHVRWVVMSCSAFFFLNT